MCRILLYVKKLAYIGEAIREILSFMHFIAWVVIVKLEW